MTEDEVRLNELEQRLVKAWLFHDWETLGALLDEDWSVIDPGGRVLTKEQIMAEAASGERKIESGNIDEDRILSFGDVAVVTGRTTAAGTYQGQSFNVRLRFTDVFVRRGDDWRVVASQGTLIPQ